MNSNYIDSLGDDSPQEPAVAPSFVPTPPPRPGQPIVNDVPVTPLPPSRPIQQPPVYNRLPVTPPPPPSPTGVSMDVVSYAPPAQQPPVRPAPQVFTPSPTSPPPAANTPFTQPQPQPRQPQVLPQPQQASASSGPATPPKNLHLIDTPNTPIASEAPPEEGQAHLVPLLKKFAKVLVFVGVVWAGAALLNAFVFQTYYVNGLSMTPTLQDSDRLIVTKLGKTGASITGKKLVPNRGDIVVLSSEVSTYTASQHEQIIKRVVALPGERVTIQNGEVKIHNSDNPDGFNLNKELDLQLSSTYTVKPIDTTVPEGAVFVLGDNRTAGGSFDSRDFGPVNLDHIEGILWMRILPFTQIHIF